MPKDKRYLSLFDSSSRKKVPMYSGLIAYFPDACAAVAEHSYRGNEKHNPGEPLHHARGKSTDHTDCIIRHVSNYKGMDGDCEEVVALVWRAMALCQEFLERKHGLTLPEGVVDPRAFRETNSLVGPNGEQAPQEATGARFKIEESLQPWFAEEAGVKRATDSEAHKRDVADPIGLITGRGIRDLPSG